MTKKQPILTNFTQSVNNCLPIPAVLSRDWLPVFKPNRKPRAGLSAKHDEQRIAPGTLTRRLLMVRPRRPPGEAK